MTFLKRVLLILFISCVFFVVIDRVVKKDVADVVGAENYSFHEVSIVHPDYGLKILSSEEVASLKEYLLNSSCTYNGSIKGVQSLVVYDGTLFHVFAYTEKNELEGSFYISDTGKMYIGYKEYILGDNQIYCFLEECYR